MSQIVPSDRQIPVPHILAPPMPVEIGTHHYSAEYGSLPNDDRIDLREVLALLRRNLRTIILVTLVIAGAGTYYVLRQPDEYSASAILRLKDVRGAITAGTGDAGIEALMMGRQTDPLLSE